MPASPRSGEFALIDRHFRRPPVSRHATVGIGDDCALLAPLPNEQLAISTDMLVAGRHFFEDVDPAALGHKALAVNLSDLAACGAQPLGATLAIALPAVDDAWLEAFASGLFALADAHACELVGGDTTRGPLTLSLTVFGSVPPGSAHLRSGASAGDDIYVSHAPLQGLGDARLALQLQQLARGETPPAATTLQALDTRLRHHLLHMTRVRLELPQPRVALGLALRGIASACADLSDGLTGDLGHILRASGLGASLKALDGAEGLLHACSPALRTLGNDFALDMALAGGDDYELVFTAPPAQREAVAAAVARCGLCASRIGRMEPQPGLRWIDLEGRQQTLAAQAFDHFA